MAATVCIDTWFGQFLLFIFFKQIHCWLIVSFFRKFTQVLSLPFYTATVKKSLNFDED